MRSTPFRVVLAIVLLTLVMAIPGLALVLVGGTERLLIPGIPEWFVYVWHPMVATAIGSSLVLPATIRRRSSVQWWTVVSMLSVLVAYVIHWLLQNWKWLSGVEPLNPQDGMPYYLVFGYLVMSIVTLPLAAVVGICVGRLGRQLKAEPGAAADGGA